MAEWLIPIECPTPMLGMRLWAGDLTSEQLRALEAHLDECAACAALIAMTPPTPALIREAARDTASHVDTPDIWYLRMRTAALGRERQQSHDRHGRAGIAGRRCRPRPSAITNCSSELAAAAWASFFAPAR